jgi:hypothetical protein
MNHKKKKNNKSPSNLGLQWGKTLTAHAQTMYSELQHSCLHGLADTLSRLSY